MYNRISSQPKVICYLQFQTRSWTGDQQSAVCNFNISVLLTVIWESFTVVNLYHSLYRTVVWSSYTIRAKHGLQQDIFKGKQSSVVSCSYLYYDTMSQRHCRCMVVKMIQSGGNVICSSGAWARRTTLYHACIVNTCHPACSTWNLQ